MFYQRNQPNRIVWVGFLVWLVLLFSGSQLYCQFIPHSAQGYLGAVCTSNHSKQVPPDSPDKNSDNHLQHCYLCFFHFTGTAVIVVAPSYRLVLDKVSIERQSLVLVVEQLLAIVAPRAPPSIRGVDSS